MLAGSLLKRLNSPLIERRKASLDGLVSKNRQERIEMPWNLINLTLISLMFMEFYIKFLLTYLNMNTLSNFKRTNDFLIPVHRESAFPTRCESTKAVDDNIAQDKNQDANHHAGEDAVELRSDLDSFRPRAVYGHNFWLSHRCPLSNV